MAPLCTVGYEGRAVDEFIEFLVANEVETVADVRERPQSRKRGFSKRTLSESLAAHGVAYVHFGELGNPKEYRDALKRGWAFDEFAEQFRELLRSRSTVLAELGAIAARNKTCLVCFEADPSRCHRSLIAEVLADTSSATIEVIHLG